jgi:hypothetical protein
MMCVLWEDMFWCLFKLCPCLHQGQYVISPCSGQNGSEGPIRGELSIHSFINSPPTLSLEHGRQTAAQPPPHALPLQYEVQQCVSSAFFHFSWLAYFEWKRTLPPRVLDVLCGSLSVCHLMDRQSNCTRVPLLWGRVVHLSPHERRIILLKQLIAERTT